MYNIFLMIKSSPLNNPSRICLIVRQ